MAGPGLTQYLAAQHYEDFQWVVRQFNHDVANKLSRATTECSIISRMMDRVPPEEIFVDLALAAQSKPLATAAQQLTDSLSKTREFFFPPNEPEEAARQRWSPYDVSAWERLIVQFHGYLTEQLEPVIPLFEKLSVLEGSGAIRPDGRGKQLLNSRISISEGIGEVENLLAPETWDALLPEWIERRQKQANL